MGETKQVTYGAGQGKKVFTLKVKNKKAAKKASETKFGYLIKDTVVRVPRSFANERTEQTLRHIATTIKDFLIQKGDKKYQEVQVGHNSKLNQIYISTNTNSSNNNLRKWLQENGALSSIAKIKMPQTLKPNSVRQKRHMDKFKARFRKSSLAEANVSIPENEEKYLDGLHAELRIKKAFGVKEHDFIPEHITIKGIKRPCAHCYPKMLKRSDENNKAGRNESTPGPGPAWQSLAAKLSITAKETNDTLSTRRLASANAIPSEEVTRSTVTTDHKNTIDHDTDSDSDAE